MISLLTLSADIFSRAFNFYWVLIDIRSSGGVHSLGGEMPGRELLCSQNTEEMEMLYPIISDLHLICVRTVQASVCPSYQALPVFTLCWPPGPHCLHKSLKLPTWCPLMMDRAFVLHSGERRETKSVNIVCPKLSLQLNWRDLPALNRFLEKIFNFR